MSHISKTNEKEKVKNLSHRTMTNKIKELLTEYDRLKLGCSIEDWHRWTDKTYRVLKEVEKGQTIFEVKK